jgi:HlyD family secretion protein
MISALKRKSVLITLGLAVVLTASGFSYYRLVYLPGQAPSEPELQTTVVRQGDLTIYASGSGTLKVGDQKELGFGTSGEVAELNVSAGDKVQAGDVLAVQGNREQLDLDVATDELAVLDAQQALDDLNEGADLAAAQAHLDLANAQDALDEAEYQWNLNQPGNRATATTLKAAEAEVKLAEKRLAQAQADVDNASGGGKAQAKIALADAQKAYDQAVWYVNWLQSGATGTERDVLEAKLEEARANVEMAQREWERLKDGPDPDEVARLQLQLENAQAKLAVSRRDLDQSVIVAPIDGIILAVDAGMGDSVSGPFITLADLSQLYMDIYLDETDMDNVAVGYEVDVTFDALPDQTFTGSVISVDPSLYTSGGLSAIRGLAKLDEIQSSDADRLLLGMNASVDVIAARVQGVALVPVEALHEISPGEYAVFVVDENGELKLRPVEVGLNDLTFAEIKSGLEVGEVVSTGIVETQ